jgi:hypothetical protein
MTRSIGRLGLATLLILACDSHPSGPQRIVENASGTGPRLTSPSVVPTDAKILSFETMYGVDEAFVNSKEIRKVRGDELPWDVGSAVGSLTVGGHLIVSVRGIVFANDPEVPANIRGTNDETQFRALVSCLLSESKGKGKGKAKGKISTVNITTAGFPATPTGDSDIDTNIQLPSDCVAPIIFILSGSEDKWFAVTGAEISG